MSSKLIKKMGNTTNKCDVSLVNQEKRFNLMVIFLVPLPGM
jgi:hypothetical protein